MNTETKTAGQHKSLEELLLQPMLNPQKGLCLDAFIPEDPLLAMKRGTAEHPAKLDAFAQFMRHKSLGALILAEEGKVIPPEHDASFFPVLWPADVDDELAQDIEDAREHATLRSVGTAEHLFTGETMGAVLEHAIAHPKQPKEVHHKYHFWSQFVALQFGVKWVGVNALEPLMALGEVLRERNAPPLIYVVYAPELVLTDVHVEAERDLLIGALYFSHLVHATAYSERQHAILFASDSWIKERNRISDIEG